MTQHQVISQLLKSDSKYSSNCELLKKIILVSYLGRLRINDLAPDRSISLSDYLFDDEHMMFDYSRLSDNKRNILMSWLLDNHQNDKTTKYLSNYMLNEYRGFTAQANLSWWGVIRSWFLNKHVERWTLSDFNLSINYQIFAMELCHGKLGTLVRFDQLLTPSSGTKYKAANDIEIEPLNNVKRVFITDNIVDILVNTDINALNFSDILEECHPQSIEVKDYNRRFEDMNAYRTTMRFQPKDSWYLDLWKWILSFFQAKDNTVSNSKSKQDNLIRLCTANKVEIYERKDTHEILVVEKTPDVDNLVTCGGGERIIAHIGVWKALNEFNVRPNRFAGSSAGAIMGMLFHLGYTADEIFEIFQHFKKEHLIHFDFNGESIFDYRSDPKSLKTAIDYLVLKKLNQIVTKYNIPFPEGQITFSTLESIRQEYPDCGIGKGLTVTATSVALQKTLYYSLEKTPNMELSEAVKTSALHPLLFRSDKVTDGGMKSNFPTEVFFDDHSTLLESESGNNLKVLAVQFENGAERTSLDKITERVPRINFLMDWLIAWISRVNKPADSWAEDLKKLRKYALQTIVVPVCEESREKMLESGYTTAKKYLELRYGLDEKNNIVNKELMYSTFNSLDDFLAYCCYRGNEFWFKTIFELISLSDREDKKELLEHAERLKGLYFNSKLEDTGMQSVDLEYKQPNKQQTSNKSSSHIHQHYSILLAIYPVFLKLTPELTCSKKSKSHLDEAFHSLSYEDPFICIQHLEMIKDKTHILLHIFIKLVKDLKNSPTEETYNQLARMKNIFYKNSELYKPEFYGNWDITRHEDERVLKIFESDKHKNCSSFFINLLNKAEPMQLISGNLFNKKLYSEDTVEPIIVKDDYVDKGINYW